MQEFYSTLLSGGVTVGTILFAISLLRIVEFVYKYAKAIPLDPEEDVMYSIYTVRVLAVLFTLGESFMRGFDWGWVKGQLDEDLYEPVTSHPGGIVIDIAAAFFLPIIVAMLLPVIVLFIVVGIPLQTLHLKNKQRAEFIEKLKGDNEDA